MSSALGSIQINGLLGGTAGKIDTDALVNALMAAKSMPKQQLQLQVANQQKITQAYQGLNTTMQAISAAATKAIDTASWTATQATSSSSAVIAASTSTAANGSTTFTVNALAAAQVSTVKADPATGNWITDYTAGIDITIGVDASNNPIVHHIDLASGSVTDIAQAVNDAGIGVRAAVVNTDTGQVLQLSSAKTGVANGFSVAGLAQPAQQVTAAQDARVSVGDPAAGGYTISSATNTFTDAMPGVTFTVGAAALNQSVTISVSSDAPKIASMVGALVDSVNSAKLAIGTYTGKGAVLQGYSDVVGLSQDLSSIFSSATPNGKSLSDYGIDLTKDGVVTFDSDVFSAAYSADPNGTMQAISDAVTMPLKTIADAASAPVTGTISQTITSGNDRMTDLNGQIDAMTDRLNKTEEQLRLKYIAMQTALAKLQSTGDWLTSMFKSMDASNQKSS
jgi:flagellar hook-associated protein 2